MWKKVSYASNITNHLDRAGLELLESFLAYNPKSRISAKDSIKHPYFENLDKENI
jgi:serine/threonine protein kinase